MTHTSTTDLEHRLTKTRVHLLHLARFVAADTTPELLAGALDSIASVAQVAAAELRGERPLR